MNLIVDERSETERNKTGNNVGKTTVLRLIDYCLGADGKAIYQDPEFPDQPNSTIYEFLTEQKVVIELVLVADLESESDEVIICKNFLQRINKIQSIDGINHKKNTIFDAELKKALLNTEVEKPTFKQIKSKNIRIDKDRMDKIVKVLGSFVSNEEYEALFMFWLGINTDQAEEKQKLAERGKKEKAFRSRLKANGELPLVEQKLAFHQDKIQEIEKIKESFNINDKYEEDIENLNGIKQKLNKMSSKYSQLSIRKELIQESKDDLEKEYTSIDLNEIKMLYDKASVLIPDVQVSFEETVNFHNDLIKEKIDFISKELPELEQSLNTISAAISQLREKEYELSDKLKKNGVAEDLEIIIVQLTEQHEKKGALEEQKKLWLESNENLAQMKIELDAINDAINQNDSLITARATQFNKYFTKLSDLLYGENYILTPAKKKGTYTFLVTNIEGNPSTGKKKGQIAAFDFAYLQFADSIDLQHLKFILHDQLENVHDNQLHTILEVANTINGQYIVSILRDKVPADIDISSYEVVSLSQDDKLFRLP